MTLSRKHMFIAGGGGLATLLLLSLGLFIFLSGPVPAPVVEEVVEEDPVDYIFRVNPDLKPFAGAPKPIRDLARAISRDEFIHPDLFPPLSPDMINKVYRADDGTPDTILTFATRKLDMEAARGLVAAGADVNFNNGAMALQAISPERDNTDETIPFPDYTDGLGFLLLYLKNGGNPNAIKSGSAATLLDYAGPGLINNLGAGLLLLEYGANPFLEPETGRGKRASFFVSNARLYHIALEYMYRLMILGYLKDAPQDQAATVVASYERDIQTLRATYGEDDDALDILWMTQQVVRALRDYTGARLTPYLEEFVREDIPQKAGWHLSLTTYYTPESPSITYDTYGDKFWRDR